MAEADFLDVRQTFVTIWLWRAGLAQWRHENMMTEG